MNPVLRHMLAGLLMIGVLIHAPINAKSQDAAAQAPDPAAPAAAAPAPEAGAENAVEPADAASTTSPLAIEPKTPEELFDGILLMVDISRNAVAKQYLKKFLADEPSEELLLKLREQYGPAAFLRLANIPELQPESKALLQRSNAAYTTYANDPARLDQFLKDLVSGTAAQQTTARHQMETAGSAVVPALISALGDPKYANSQTTFVEMLVRIGNPAVPALHAALLSPDPKTRQAVMLSLGLIRNESSIPYLLRFASQTPPTDEATTAKKAIGRILKNDALVRVQLQNVANRLIHTARDYFLGRHVWELDKNQLVSVWAWDQSIRTVREQHVPPEVAARREGLFFARSALEVAPDRTDIQSTYLNLLFADEIATSGLSKPLKSGPGSTQDLALSLGADAVARALSEAMELNKPDSALVALQILAKIGTVQQVRVRNGKQSAIQRALNYPSRRVQFAAAQAIVAIDPTTSYPGAERVVAILGRALTQADSTEKLAMVLDSVIDRGQTIAGFLNDLGYTPTHRQTGREGFQTAAKAQELDLILLDANIQRWALSETLTNLKFDPRTMDVPVLIYGEAITERNIRVYTRQFRNVYYIEMPATSDDLRRQLGPAITQQSEPPLTPGERSTKALRAAEMLGYLSSGQRRKLYDFTPIEKHLLTTSENSQLAPFLLPALNTLPTISAQRRIAELAATDQQPNEVRSIAARQLVSHIRQFGLLITPEQVELLRNAWEQTKDQILSSELSSVMGILKPNTVLVGQRLRQVSEVPAPAPGPAPAPEGAPEKQP